MAAFLISDVFIRFAGGLVVFMLMMPIIAKVIHVIRAQVRKALFAMKEDEDSEDESEA